MTTVALAPPLDDDNDNDSGATFLSNYYEDSGLSPSLDDEI